MPRDTRHRVGLLAGISALAGLLVAGLVAPLIGGLAVVARASADSFERLPAELETGPLPQSSRILAADGKVIATFYDENRIAVPLHRVAPIMRYAILAIEDSRFYEHRGLDLKATLRALINNAQGGDVQGGSTLTQQYVKNVLLEEAETAAERGEAQGRDVARKLRELKYALALEDKLSKNEILERYLNIAYFGDGAYGVEAAARHFFRTSAARLTLPQAALLAGLVQQPVRFDPTKHPEAALARRNVVLDRMVEVGYVTADRVVAARRTPLGLKLTPTANGCVTSLAPTFCDYVLAIFRTTPELGGQRALYEGGLTVRTTLDLKAQRAAQAAVSRYVAAKDQVIGALAMVEPGTGAVRALAQSRPYGGKEFKNYTVDHRYGASLGGQPGSTFKIFTLTEALRQGIPVSTRIYAPACYRSTYPGDSGGRYRPCNAGDSEAGRFDLRTGTWHSVNTFFVQLQERVGVTKVAALAARMGAHQADRVDSFDRSRVGGSFTLGALEVSPLTLASSYATVAAHGLQCDPYAVVSVRKPNGETVEAPREPCRRVVDAEVADTVTDIMTGVLTKGTARGIDIGRPAAGKTGTNTESRGAWFAGYTPQLSAAVGIWHPTKPSTFSLRNIRIGGRYYPRSVYGATIPGPIWAAAMKGALDGVPVVPFAPPSKDVARGKQLTVPDVSGLEPADAADVLKAAGFRTAVAATRVPSVFPAGTVAGTTPPAGSQSTTGTTVTLLLSTGTPPAPTATPAPPPGPGPGPGPKPTKPPKPEPTPTPAPSPTPSEGGPPGRKP